jgi:hypothetical protein
MVGFNFIIHLLRGMAANPSEQNHTNMDCKSSFCALGTSFYVTTIPTEHNRTAIVF